jgi:hypothetical protein
MFDTFEKNYGRKAIMKNSMKRILALLFTLVLVFSSAILTVSAAEDAQAAPASLQLMDGAAVRLVEGESGLRFETRILTSELAALGDDVTLGTLILPTDLLGATEFTVEALTAAGKDFVDLTSKDEGVALSTDGEYTVFYAAIINILPENYARAFSARSYVKVGESYYYTGYSDANNSRSVYGVAAAAWEDEAKDNAIVKAYLDKVVRLSGALRQIAIKDYVSPFSVSYEGGKLVFSGASALAKSDLASVVIDDVVYTGGWDVVDGKLAAPYSLTYYEGFNGLTNDTATNASDKNGAAMTIGNLYILAKADSDTNDVKVAVKDAEGKSFDCLKIIYDAKDQTQGRIEFRGNLGELVTAGKTMLTISFSVKPDEGYTSVPGFNAVLGSKGTSLFKITNESKVTLGGKTVATVKGATEYIDITIKIDLKNNCAYGYCNGELVQTATYSAPSGYTTLADWAKANATGDIISISQLCNKNDTAELCFDNLVVRVH